MKYSKVTLVCEEMEKYEQFKDDLNLLDIGEEQELTKRYVTGKYKKKAKLMHPDKLGGKKEDFQDLYNAYCRLLEYIEDNQTKEAYEEEEEDYETEFFKKHNVLKECTSSFVLYIQNELADRWQKVLEKHLTMHSCDKCRIIFKTGDITVTLYVKPKKDPKSKVHIQGKSQKRNLEFIMEKLSMFYFEVCVLDVDVPKAIVLKDMQRSHCVKCGKFFTNKRGLKQHVAKMHTNILKKPVPTKSIPLNNPVTLEEVSENISFTKSTIIVTANPGGNDVLSPLRKKNKLDSSYQENINDIEIIQSLVSEVLDTVPDSVDKN